MVLSNAWFCVGTGFLFIISFMSNVFSENIWSLSYLLTGWLTGRRRGRERPRACRCRGGGRRRATSLPAGWGGLPCEGAWGGSKRRSRFTWSCFSSRFIFLFYIFFFFSFFRLSKTPLSLLNMKGRPGSQPATSSGQWRETLGTPTFWSKLNSQVCTYDCASSLLCNQVNFLKLHYLILKYNLISLKGFHFFKQLAGSTMRSCGSGVISHEICNHDIFWFWCNILLWFWRRVWRIYSNIFVTIIYSGIR